MKTIKYSGINGDINIFAQEYSRRDLLISKKKKTRISGKKNSRYNEEKIVKEFLDLLLRDMIEENNILLLPEKRLGAIYITNIARPERKDYIYDIMTDGKLFGPKVGLSKEFIRITKKVYKARLSDKYNNLLQGLVKQGRGY